LRTCALADKPDIREVRNLFLVGVNVGGYALYPGHWWNNQYYEEFAFDDDEINEIASILGEDADVLRLKMGANASEMTLLELVTIIQFIESKSDDGDQRFELEISKIDEGADDPSQYYPRSNI
jgi:hypothetical protein